MGELFICFIKCDDVVLIMKMVKQPFKCLNVTELI